MLGFALTGVFRKGDCRKLDEQKGKVLIPLVGEARKRVLAIVAGILVARHLKTADDLFDSRSSPRTESLVAAAVPQKLGLMTTPVTVIDEKPIVGFDVRNLDEALALDQ